MANENDYIPEGTGTDGEVLEGDDLKSSSKDTLGSYLSGITSNSATGNKYRIEDIPRVEVTLQSSTGLPSEFQTGGSDSNPGFTNEFPTAPNSAGAATSHFETLSNSGKIPDLGLNLNKNAQTDGHTLLSDFISNREADEPGIGDPTGQTTAATPAGAPVIQQKVSQMLTDGNRFDPTPGSSPYIEDGEFTAPGIPIEQGEFGIYNDDAVRTSLQDLEKIAASLLLRQTGHGLNPSANPSSVNTGPTNPYQKGQKKVNTTKLRPRNAYNAPSRPSLANGELEYDDITGAPLEPHKSFGALSSYKEKFETARIKNLRTASGALVEYFGAASVFVAIVTLVEVLETGTTHIPGSPQTLKKGQWKNHGGMLKLLRSLGIPNLDNAPILCAIYGLAAWMKLPPSVLPSPSGTGAPPMPPPPPPFPPPVPGGGPGPMSIILLWFSSLHPTDAFTNVLYGSGYYANVMRVVRRDMEKLLTEVTISTSGTSGPDAAIGIFKILTTLNTYNSWNFFVAILNMGDAWLRSYRKYIRYGHMKMSGQTRQQHSRVPGGSGKLSWRHRSAPALALLNHKYVNASSVYGYDPDFLRKLHGRLGDGQSRSNDGGYWGNLRPAGKNRGLFDNSSWNVKRETKEAQVLIENELDSEYCPFYFHDLRTNEIIGFHAFLSDIKDSYSVSYAESGGYGRIDKVKIYQDTTRSISFSFTMVATSPEDFDSMWWSFNKLISMIYPQFSMGKPVKAGSKKFIMPFSQIPTASPVIRLRIGDLIRSNYSRFNLARLFGLSEVKPAPIGGVSSEAPGGGSGVNPAFADIAAAPFDISATAALESATAEAEAEAAEAAEDAEADMELRFAFEPYTTGEVAYGYLPGDPLWGKAILQPSSRGYTTYDTNAGIIVPATVGPSTLAGVINKHATNPPADGATHVESTPFPSRPASSGIVNILERCAVGPDEGESVDQDDDEIQEQIHAEYYVQYVDQDDSADPYGPASGKGHFHTYVVTSGDLTPIPPPAPAPAEPDDVTVSLGSQITDVTDFFNPDNNAIVRSFEAAGGRGLAGVITSLDFEWGDAQWDMSGIGRRAPTLLNISMGFNPIHDIIPGLDNNGMMRAMNYPVGNIAGPMGTDPVDPGAIQHPTFAMRSTVPGATYPGDASAANYSGFIAGQDDDGEGE